MKYTPHTISYFLSWGMIYGCVFALWSTTIMLPVIGTIFGFIWGIGLGVACGLLCGAVASLIQAYTFHPDVNLPAYRVRMSLVMGVMVGVVAPALLHLTSHTVLWGPGARGIETFYAPSMLAAIFWGGLSAAYVGHGYPLWLAQIMMGKPYFSTARLSIEDAISALTRSGIIRVALSLGALIGAVWGGSDVLRSSLLRDPAIPNPGLPMKVIMQGTVGGIAGIIAAFVVLLLICCGVAALIVLLKRLLFANDTLISSHRERITLTAAATLLTGIICFWPFTLLQITAYQGWFFPLLCALMMGFYTYRTLPTTLDKAKRKEKGIPIPYAA